jgi:ribose transport system ATP-binding protein
MSKTTFSAKNVVKHFGGVTALSDGNIEIASGEVVALLGANGSGKSTLSKALTGVVVPNSGQLLRNEKPMNFSSPLDAKNYGIASVYQELSLIPRMTIAENIWLMHEPTRGTFVNQKELFNRTADLLDLFKGTISASIRPDSYVYHLGSDERQIVEILKAYSLKPSLLILDEATASLDNKQVDRLFSLIENWKKEEIAIEFISHRLEEVFRIADKVTVLRNGKTVAYSIPIVDIKRNDLVRYMVGEKSLAKEHELYSQERLTKEKTAISIHGLRGINLRGISVDVKEGEILGLGGLRGQGQSEMLLSIFGAIQHSGKIEINGKLVTFTNPKQAINQGIAFVPGDRNSQGLFSIRSILENLMLPSWEKYGTVIRMKAAVQDAEKISKSLNLVMGGLNDPVSSLSGGNAQKVVVGKWLLKSPKILLLDDPTKGVDVGAKDELYQLLYRLREQGTTILFYSSEDDELLNLCDRIVVFYDGQINAVLTGEDINKNTLVSTSMSSQLIGAEVEAK